MWRGGAVAVLLVAGGSVYSAGPAAAAPTAASTTTYTTSQVFTSYSRAIFVRRHLCRCQATFVKESAKEIESVRSENNEI